MIIIQHAQLGMAAAKLEAYTQQLHDLNNRLASIIGDVGATWEGQASSAWVAMMIRRQQQAEALIPVLEEFKSYAEKAKEEFVEEDNSAASIILSAF